MTTVRINIANITKVLKEEALKTAEQASQIGEKAARKKLDDSITRYGLKRFAAGRGQSAGRNDTGSMINALRALKPVVKAEEVLASFGWGRGRSKRYYKFQEEGTGRIKAANSLLTGKRAVLNELPRLEKNMKARISRRLSK
jgi:hypothetical protein